MADLWCIETNTGELSAHTPAYLHAEQPYPVQAVGHDGNVYLINPAWPLGEDGQKLQPALVTLAHDGVTLRAKTAAELRPAPTADGTPGDPLLVDI